MVQKQKVIAEKTEKTETVDDADIDAEFIDLVDKIGNANSVLSPSNIDDADYKIVGKGIADVDYKDGSGVQRIPYYEFSDFEGTIIKAKITSRMKEALNDSGIDYTSEPFHFTSKGKGFNVTVSITKAIEAFAE